MAENETLDLWDRYSGRWRRLLALVEKGEPAETIADEAARCLYQTFKNLVELLPLEEMLQAASRGDRAALNDLVRGCRKGRDYAELFAQQAAIHTDPVQIIEGVARAATDEIFNQIGMKIDPDGHWPDIAQLRVLREDVMMLMRDDLARLAGKVADHPNEKPRMPARSADQKEKDQRDLLNLSLRPRLGTHG